MSRWTWIAATSTAMELWTWSPPTMLRMDVSILLGLGVVQGVPQFGPAVHHLVGEAPWAVRCAPVDGDGYADIITAGFTEDAVSILINDGAGGVAADDSYSVAVGNAPRVTTRCNSRPAAISIKRSRCSSAILTCSTWRRLVFTRSSSIPTGMAASSARSKPISSPSTRPLKAGRCWDAVDHDAHVRRGPAPE